MSAPLPRCRTPDATPSRLRFRLLLKSTTRTYTYSAMPSGTRWRQAGYSEPPPVTAADYLNMSEKLGIERAVIVHSAA